MNFRAMSIEELAGYLQAETSQARFINGAKEFIRKFLSTQYYTEDEYEEAVEKALNRGRTEGRKEAMEDAGLV